MNLADELEAIHRNLTSLDTNRYVTKPQIGAIIMLLQEGIGKVNRPLRIAVLRAFIAKPMKRMCNVNVQSTKNITGEMASFLIEMLKDPRKPDIRLSAFGQRLITETVKYVEENNLTSEVEPQ